MSDLENNQEILKKRKNILKDDEETGLKVTASLRDQQLEKLAAKLEDLDIGQKVVELWERGNADRAEYLARQEEYDKVVDEFMEPIYPAATEWSSTLHLPTILTVGKTYHARMMAALLGIDPPFTVRSRSAANVDRAMLVEELMRYTIRDWANEYEGVEAEVDKWLWDWCMRGCGILKGRWHKKFTRFEDVDVEEIEDVRMEIDPQTGETVPVPFMRQLEREVKRTIEVFNGPCLERKFIEDVVIIGGEGDPQKADAVIDQDFLTASELWSYADQKIFRADIVEEVIKGGRDTNPPPDITGGIKQKHKRRSGMSEVTGELESDRFHILEAYIKVDVDGSGITSDLIVWVHKNSKKILRATYLRRVNPTGKVPFFKIDFHLRHGTTYGVGLIELLYSLAKEIDAIHNIKIDIGILSSLPFGFYRPTTSALKSQQMPIEPGALIPVDNPQTDVFFPNLGLRTTFGFQEEAALQTQIERLTSISDLNLGLLSGQGAARTATGTRALLGESTNNLSIYIQRMARGWKRALRYLFCMLQYRLPPGFQFRITGDDGNSYWRKIESREELQGMYDFEIDANSGNSNKQVQIEQANLIYQLTGNPLDLQLGVVTPLERYEAIKNLLKVNGVKDISKYARKPQGLMTQLAPIEIADRILNGMDVQLDPTQDLQGFIALVEEFMTNDELNGQLAPHQLATLVAKAQEAQGLIAALQQAEASQLAATQQQMNSQAAMVPQNNQPVAVNQPPPPGEGG